MRVTLGRRTAAGFEVWDGDRMLVFYYDTEEEELARIYVGSLNLVDSVRKAQAYIEEQVMIMLHADED